MIRQREFVIRNRRRLALLATLGVLALAVVLEHSGLGHGEIAEADMGQGISMCLAIVEAGAVLIGALALVTIRQRFTPVRLDLFAGPSPAMRAANTPIPPSRAGPSVLQVFRR